MQFQRRPLLLLLDCHSSHCQPDVMHIARDYDVVMLCLPPHITHEALPLDVGVFSSLKSQWTQVSHDYFHNNPGRVITNCNLNLLFSQPWLKSLVPANIIAGFKKSGVYPYDSNAIAIPSEFKRKPQPKLNNLVSSMSQTVEDSKDNENDDGLMYFWTVITSIGLNS